MGTKIGQISELSNLLSDKDSLPQNANSPQNGYFYF
jgi:hypothetical protein